MKISIGSDHGGFELKQKITFFLQSNGYIVLDRGCYSLNSVDYPDYAGFVATDIQNHEADFGILICTTGIGMSISANKFLGIRAALVTNFDSAHFARKHNNCNIICLGQKYTTAEDAIKYVDIFVNETFIGDRHQRRIDLIKAQEEKEWKEK